MDAIKFVNEMVRMCAEYPKCDGCPVVVQNDDEDCMAKVPAEQMVAIVEEWAKKNPRQDKTERVSGAVAGGKY